MTIFNRKELFELLNECRSGLAAVGLIPELSHFWFDGKNVYAYDGGLGIRRRLESDLNCGLPGKVLLDLLRTSSLKEVSIEESGTNGVTIKMGRARVQLVSIESERHVWPFPKVLPKKDGLKLNANVMAAFDSLSFVKVSRGTMAVHHGIVFDVGHENIRLYATDGKSIAHQRVAARSVSMPQFIAPWGFVSAAANLLNGGQEPKLWLLDDCLIAGAPGTMIASNILELPSSPNLPKVMDAKAGGSFRPLPKGLQPLLERAAILTGASDAYLNISVSKGSLRLHGKWPMGIMDERIELEGKTENVSVKLPAELIARALDKADKFSLTERALMLVGDKGTFEYLVSTRSKGKE